MMTTQILKHTTPYQSNMKLSYIGVLSQLTRLLALYLCGYYFSYIIRKRTVESCGNAMIFLWYVRTIHHQNDLFLSSVP